MLSTASIEINQVFHLLLSTTWVYIIKRDVDDQIISN